MASRLLSLLSLVETALQRDAIESGTAPPEVGRLVNYPKGLARITINAGAGGIFFQHFDLAAGEICVRATVAWRGCEETGQAAIYPQGEAFDWPAAAARVAAVWIAGPKAVVIQNAAAEPLRSAG